MKSKRAAYKILSHGNKAGGFYPGLHQDSLAILLALLKKYGK